MFNTYASRMLNLPNNRFAELVNGEGVKEKFKECFKGKKGPHCTHEGPCDWDFSLGRDNGEVMIGCVVKVARPNMAAPCDCPLASYRHSQCNTTHHRDTMRRLNKFLRWLDSEHSEREWRKACGRMVNAERLLSRRGSLNARGVAKKSLTLFALAMHKRVEKFVGAEALSRRMMGDGRLGIVFTRIEHRYSLGSKLDEGKRQWNRIPDKIYPPVDEVTLCVLRDQLIDEGWDARIDYETRKRKDVVTKEERVYADHIILSVV